MKKKIICRSRASSSGKSPLNTRFSWNLFFFNILFGGHYRSAAGECFVRSFGAARARGLKGWQEPMGSCDERDTRVQ